MFTRDGRVVAIDNLLSFTPMTEVIRELGANPRRVAERVRTFLVDNARVDVGAEGEAALAKGMTAMAQKIARLDRPAVERLIDAAKARGEFRGRGTLDRFLEGVEAFGGEKHR